MKNNFKAAHKMTKEMVEKYGVDYQAQFGLCLSYLLENKEEEELENISIAKELLEQAGLSTEQKEKALKGVERLNSINKELANEWAVSDKIIKRRLKNAGLYANQAGLEFQLIGEGKIETKNMKLWMVPGKARIYFDLVVDGIVVQQSNENSYIAIR